MKSGKAGKMATTLTVLLLVLSGLAVVQGNAQSVEATEQEDHGSKLWGIIDGSIDSDLDIKLKSLSTGEMVEEKQTSENLYEFTDVKPGWYEVILPSQISEGTAYMKETEGPIELIGENKKSSFAVDTEPITHSIEVNVTYEGDPVEDVHNVTLTLENRTRGFSYDDFELDSEENATFVADVYEGFEGSLMVEKEEYAPQFTPSLELDVENETTFKNIDLSKTPVIQGYLTHEGEPIDENLDLTLYNEDLGVMHRTRDGTFFKMRAPPGDYTLVINAHGFRPEVIDVSIDDDSREKLGELGVEKSVTEECQTDIDFNHGDDLNDLQVTSSRQIQASTQMETLDYSFIGNLAMQIDLTLGETDLELTEDEVDEFKKRLTYTHDIKYTSQFIEVNDTAYELEEYESSFSDGFEDALTGDVTGDLFEDVLSFTSTRRYTAVDNIDDANHIVDLKVQNDHIYGNERNFTYSLNLTEGYERYIGEGSAESIPENVELEGYTSIDIFPGEDGMTSDLTFDIRESEEGKVEIMLERKPGIYEPEDKENYTDFVLGKDTEAEITAQYENPISRAVNYTWWLDGEKIKSGENGSELTHAFNDTGKVPLRVEVEESSGNVTTDEIEIMVDDEGPQGDYILVDGEETEVNGTATVDENTEISFNASAFEDAATGMVSNYEWNFTETNETKRGANMTNVSYTFTSPGLHDVILNVTNPVGNWNEVKISVKVNDTTDPMAVIKAEWDDQTSEESTINIPKNTKVKFNGTGSQAHPDYEGNLTFEWEIEELDEEGTGPFFSYEFKEIREYTVTLYATDDAGNTGNQTIVVNTNRGSTSNLRVSDLRFSTRDVREGDEVTISVNITNDGDKNATQLNPILRVDGEIIDISPKYYQDGDKLNETEIRIESEETVTMKVGWTPETNGDLTVTVNVTDGDEPSDLYWNNEVEEESFTVDQPAWREYIVYALIPIIIIGVTVGLYFYRDKLKELLGR